MKTHNNADRAHAAELALVAFAGYMESRKLEELANSRQSNGEWLTDILTDLRHWARVAGVDFDDATRLSGDHFQCELDEEGGAE